MMLDIWNLAIASLASLLVLVGAIAFLRWLFSTIYATRNLHDTMLLEWMNRVCIPNWKALQQKSGLSSTALWRFRNGEVDLLKFSELSQIATIFCVSLVELLEKLGLPLEHPELEARRQECTQLTSLAFKRDLAADFVPPPRLLDGISYTAELVCEMFLREIWQQV